MAATAEWKVTGQRQTTISNGQTYVPAMIISYVTGLGNYGNITVDAKDYNGPTIVALLQAAADQIDTVGQFQTPGFPLPGPLDAGG